MNTPERVRCLILGSGPAGYTAAIYACRSNMNPVLYEGIQPGGQLTTTTDIENFPGYSNGISGTEMMEDFKNQALRFGADIRSGLATSANLSVRPFQITIEGNTIIEADTLIIATGASAKYLGLDDEKKYAGMGVSACATCDGFFYRRKTVAVVGGGDTACEEAAYLANLANKVYLVVRRDQLRASKIMQERVMNNDKIEVLFNCQTTGLYGEKGVEGMMVAEFKGTSEQKLFEVPIDGFFLAIGHQPNTLIFKNQIQCDAAGYIITKQPYTQTNIAGVFAAGDVADPNYRQAITAAASGCKAAIDAERYLIEQNI